MFAIGEFEFLWISQYSPGTQPVVELESRPGVPDIALWDLGEKGEPFQVQTFKGAEDFDTAKELYEEYKTIVKTRVAFSFGHQLDEQVSVLRVRPVPGGIRQIVMGLQQDEPQVVYAVCECVWDLVAHPVVEEEG